jgi:methyl-accepting chemotaxis protein
MNKNLSVSQIISASAASIFAVGMLVMIAITGMSMWFQSVAKVQDELAASYGQVDIALADMDVEIRSYAVLLAQNPEIGATLSNDPSAIDAFLNKQFQLLRANDPEVAVLEVLDKDGIVVHRAHSPAQKGDDKKKQPVVVMAMKNDRASAVTYSAASRQVAYVGIEAIRNMGKVVGYVTVGKRFNDKALAQIAKATRSDVTTSINGMLIGTTRADIDGAALAKIPANEGKTNIAIASLKLPTSSLMGYAGFFRTDDGQVLSVLLTRDRLDIWHNFRAFLFWPGVLAIVAFALALPLVIVAGRRFAGRISSLGHVMARLAANRFDVDIPMMTRQDEFGAMARAIAVFRDNGLKVQEAEAIRSKDIEKAAGRLQALEGFRLRMETVVASAIKGDLTNRLPMDNTPSDLVDLANGINRLLDGFNSIISQTVEGMERIAEGDLTSRINSVFHGDFDRLKTAANALAAAFQTTLGEMVSVTNDVKGATDEVLAGVNDLSHRTATQADIAAETITRLSAFADSFSSASGMAGMAAQSALQAEKHASSGEAYVQQTQSAMERISMSSRRISDITHIIDEVAFQTNLLALNAAVEAARAGDAGRGFAVVASEVRALAQRAASASQDVQELVNGAVQEVGNGVDSMKSTAEAFRLIATSIADVNKMVRTVAQSSGSQVQSVDQLNREISRLGDMAQQNAALVEESNAMLDSTNTRLEDLSRLAKRFRIEAGESTHGRRLAA